MTLEADQTPVPAVTPDIILDVRGLTATYANGARGLSGVNLSVRTGEIVAVLGRNGAGKTTTLRSIAGFLRSERVTVTGRVNFAGHNIVGMTPTATYRRGIVLVREREKVFSNLTVDEHLRLVSGARHADRSMDFEPLERLRKSRAGLLSGGERQMLALEVALRGSPRLLLVDEVSLGLAPAVVKDVLQRLRAIARERRTPVIIVEQDAASALRMADTAYVVNHGEVVWDGAADTISAIDLGRQYLGTVQ